MMFDCFDSLIGSKDKSHFASSAKIWIGHIFGVH